MRTNCNHYSVTDLNLRRLPQILSRKEVAELLQVSYYTLEAWDRKRTLKARRVSGRILYLKNDVKRVLQILHIMRANRSALRGEETS
ncbi:helix-turn-helix domain-containing protein [Robertkochia aurantiaca]|uniref:helix-turn-helix domain-containing protein n=1 Tax=Robertkochia aurantiaca TaxID=2873700 RepID=UPI001CCA5A85